MDELRVGVNELREVVNEHLDSNQQSKNSLSCRTARVMECAGSGTPLCELRNFGLHGTTAHAVRMTTSGGDEASESAELLHLHPNVIH